MRGGLPPLELFLPAEEFESIIFGQQHRCRRPIRFRDDPDADASAKSIRAQDARALRHRPVIQPSIFGTDISPVASHVPADERGRAFPAALERLYSTGSGDDAAKWEKGTTTLGL